MTQTKYRYPKLDRAVSYQKYLKGKIEEVKMLGAILDVKEYSGRCPAYIKDLYGGAEYLRDIDCVVVTLWSGKNMIAHALLDRDFYFTTLKVSDREGTDDMIESANRNFLYPLENKING